MKDGGMAGRPRPRNDQRARIGSMPIKGSGPPPCGHPRCRRRAFKTGRSQCIQHAPSLRERRRQCARPHVRPWLAIDLKRLCGLANVPTRTVDHAGMHTVFGISDRIVLGQIGRFELVIAWPSTDGWASVSRRGVGLCGTIADLTALCFMVRSQLPSSYCEDLRQLLEVLATEVDAYVTDVDATREPPQGQPAPR